MSRRAQVIDDREVINNNSWQSTQHITMIDVSGQNSAAATDSLFPFSTPYIVVSGVP